VNVLAGTPRPGWEEPSASPAHSAWETATTAACLLAVDPAGLGGIVLRASPGPVRDAWLALLRDLLPAGTPIRRVPAGIPDSRLLGGLDMAATLQAGRPIAERGVLAEADGGVLLLAMAERLPPGTAARIAAALDAGEVVAERDGLPLRAPFRAAAVALDEGASDEERPPPALSERLAFAVTLDGVSSREAMGSAPLSAAVPRARAGLSAVTAGDDVLEALCGTALALGIASLRAPWFALRAACTAAALAGRDAVSEADTALAARLVLAPRATCLPPPTDQTAPEEPPPPDDTAKEAPQNSELDAESLRDIVLAAAVAALPPGVLAQLRVADAARRAAAEGKAGAGRASARRGRPIGARPGALRHGAARLSLVETLRAAAPWQAFRRAERGVTGPQPCVLIRKEDIRIRRFRERTGSVAIFVVDASGSSALHRLAEAKGAVEALLAECYVRRDQVALIAFRGTGAELLLPPTGSLVRAKRCLAALPGGGGTPLAAGLDAAGALAGQVRRRGRGPVALLLTDGRANVARDGGAGRARAEEEALAAARLLRAQGLTALVIDTAPRPQPQARAIAEAMGARYLPLPQADGRLLSQAARALVPA
jgi:magnesium chelatase subunit D